MDGKRSGGDEMSRRRRPGVLRELIGEAAARELVAVLDEPLSDRDQRVLEGEATDEVGLWVGLPEERDMARVRGRKESSD